jgi:hypothetical protein
MPDMHGLYNPPRRHSVPRLQGDILQEVGMDDYQRAEAVSRELMRALLKNDVVAAARKIHLSSTKDGWGGRTSYIIGHKKLKEALKKLDELEGRK